MHADGIKILGFATLLNSSPGFCIVVGDDSWVFNHCGIRNSGLKDCEISVMGFEAFWDYRVRPWVLGA